MKIGDEVYVQGYVDEIRNDVIIIRNDGGYFGTVAEECYCYEEDERGYGTMNEADTPQPERIKTPDYCDICNHKGCDNCIANNLDDYCVPSGYTPKDTPQTDGYMTVEQAEDYHKMLDKAEHKVYGNIADTPLTDCSKCETYWNCQGQCDEVPQIEDEPQTETSTNLEKLQSGVEVKQTDCAWK